MGSLTRKLKRQADANAVARARSVVSMESELLDMGRQLTREGRKHVLHQFKEQQAKAIEDAAAQHHESELIAAVVRDHGERSHS